MTADEIAAMQADALAQAAEIARLREALQPFAHAWGVAFDRRPEVVARLSLGELAEIAKYHVPATAFRAARAALEAKP